MFDALTLKEYVAPAVTPLVREMDVASEAGLAPTTSVQVPGVPVLL
jgi:hypothetical protein